MTFGARLEAIGKLVPKNKILADIGTDHGYLPVLLVKEGKIEKAIAGDIAAGPCEAARNTIISYNYVDAIEVRQGDGLKVLKPGEAEVIAICGMGGTTIIHILEASPEIIAKATRIILQPMNGADLLRHWCEKNGWKLVAEDLVEDTGKLYEILALEKGESKSYPEIYYEVGPLLIEEKHPMLLKQIDKLIGKYNNVLDVMGKSKAVRQTEKYKHFLKQKETLEDLKNENNS